MVKDKLFRIRRVIKSVFELIELHFKGFFYRRRFKVSRINDSLALSDCTITIAESAEDLKKSMALVHESYKELSISNPNSYKLHFTKYHLLPNTLTVIVKHKFSKEVIATVSLISDSPLGLPMDEIEDLSKFRKKGRVGEASFLAISKQARKSNGEILFPMVQYIYGLARQRYGLDYAVFMFHPKASDFYRLILSARSISGKVHRYTGANGAPAIAMCAPFNKKGLKEVEHNSLAPMISREMAQYLTTPSNVGEKIPSPSPKFFSDYQSIPGREVLREFLPLCKEFYQSTWFEILPKLQNVFLDKFDKKTFSKENILRFSRRRQDRLLSKCKGIALTKNRILPIYTLDVSLNGLCLISEDLLPLDEMITIKLKIGPSKKVNLKAKVEWQQESGQHGLTIPSSQSWHWAEFINYLTNVITRNREEFLVQNGE